MSSNRKIKICFVATYTYALFHRDNGNYPITGLDVQLYNWAIAFAEDPHFEVHFVVGDFGQPKIEHIDGVTLWKSSKPRRRGLASGLVSFLILARVLMRVEANIYIDRGASGPISFEIAFLSLLLRKKYIHMIASDADIDGGYKKKAGIFETIFHSGALRMADMVTYQNSYQSGILKKKGIRALRVRNSFPIKQRAMTEGEHILWVGSSYALKRPEILLELAKAFPLENFILILQKHDENIFIQIKEQARGIGNVTFIPGVPFHEVDAFFEKAKIFINTSVYEGFPNTFIQAAIYSVPILSLKVDPDFILSKEKIGMVCDDSITVLKSNLSKILEFQEQREVLSENAASFALCHFDIKKNKEDFSKMFMNILC